MLKYLRIISRLLLVAASIILLAGCATSRTWTTADGKILDIKDKNVFLSGLNDLDTCEGRMEPRSYSGWDRASYCILFGKELYKYDPLNALEYMKKGFLGEAKNYTDFSTFISKAAKEGILPVNKLSEYRDIMYDICFSRKLSSNPIDRDVFCDLSGELYEKYEPVNIDKAIKSYYECCNIMGSECYKYENLSGNILSESAKQQYTDNWHSALDRHNNDRNAQIEQQQQEQRERNIQSAEENKQWNESMTTVAQTMQNSLNQGIDTMNRTSQQIAEVNEQIRLKKEDRERETREAQLRRAEDAATQRRDADEKRRIQQQREQEQRNRELLALERSQKDEAERRQRQEDQQRQAQQRQNEEGQQTKSKRSAIPGGRYDNCIQQGYNEADLASFPDAYFLNTCGETLHVKHILADGSHSGSWNYEPGKKSGIGGFCGKKCVADGGGFILAVCPQGWIPKTADGSYWGTSSNFRQGYYCEQQD